MALAAAHLLRRRAGIAHNNNNPLLSSCKWTPSRFRYCLRNFCSSSSTTSTGDHENHHHNNNNDNVILRFDDHMDDDDDPFMLKEEFEVGSHLVSLKTRPRMHLKSYRNYMFSGRCLKWRFQNREAVVMDMGETNKLLSVVRPLSGQEDVTRGQKDIFPHSPSVRVAYAEVPFLVAQKVIHSAQQKEFPSWALLRRPSLRDIIKKTIERLFPAGCYGNPFVLKASVGVVKSDGEQDPIIMGANATSAALMLTDIAWGGPVGVVRIGRIKGSDHSNGGFVINPGMDQMISESCDLDLVYACNQDGTLMVEVEACEVSDRDIEAALRLAHQEATKYIEAQIRLAERAGKLHNKKDYRLYLIPDHIKTQVENKVKSLVRPQIEAAINNHPDNYRFYRKESTRKQVLDEIKQNLEEVVLGKEFSSVEDKDIRFQRIVPKAVDTPMKNVVKSRIIEEGIRVDGRRLDEVRSPSHCKSGSKPEYRGPSLFAFGDSPFMCCVKMTKISEDDQTFSLIHEYGYKNLYRFRRNFYAMQRFDLINFDAPIEKHADKDFLAVLPPPGDFPYTVYVEVELDLSVHCTSTTYADTVCGASLALMDAGIPLKRHVAGVSMGLVSEADSFTGIIKDRRILTDIDHDDLELGDMHLKIAGTRKGVTAMRLENLLKLTSPTGVGTGIPIDIICESVEPARKARFQFLDHMEREIDAPCRTSSSFIHNGWDWPTLDDSESCS